MKKIITFALFITANTVFAADIPHVEWTKCDNGLCCPSALYCKDSDCGDTQGWDLYVFPMDSELHVYNFKGELAHAGREDKQVTILECDYQAKDKPYNAYFVKRNITGYTLGDGWNWIGDPDKYTCSQQPPLQCPIGNY